MDSKKMREYKYIRNTLPISNRHMNGESLVEFSIDSEKYDFEEGMTWNDWVNSAFNTIGLRSTNWGVTDSSGFGIYDSAATGAKPVQGKDKIKTLGKYIIS